MPNGTRVTQAIRKMIVMPESSTCRAISFGVFWRLAPSTRPIMRSRNDSPGFTLMRTTDAVGEDLGAAGDGGAIAAALADDGRGLAGDRGLVHGAILRSPRRRRG
jgi:hypothetical protein